MNPVVSIIMGSTSDLPVMEKAAKFLDEMEIPFEMNALSAHRTPVEVETFAREAKDAGTRQLVDHRLFGGILRRRQGNALRRGSIVQVDAGIRHAQAGSAQLAGEIEGILRRLLILPLKREISFYCKA